MYTRWPTFSAAALVAIGSVDALGSVLAGCAGTLIYVDLTHGAGEAWDRQTQRSGVTLRQQRVTVLGYRGQRCPALVSVVWTELGPQALTKL